jgi:hypothetical protein
LNKISFLFLLFFLSSCGVLEKKPQDPTLDFLQRPLTLEESNKLTDEVGGNFLYGQGFGEALVNIGGIVIWPPYAIYVLGNSAISLSGYNRLHVTNLLPEPIKDSYNTGYDFITSGPGRLAASIGEQEYRNQDVIKKRYRKILEKKND